MTGKLCTAILVSVLTLCLWAASAVPVSASLASLGYRVLRWFDTADIEQHDLTVSYRLSNRQLDVTDQMTLRATKKTDAVFFVLTEAAELHQVTVDSPSPAVVSATPFLHPPGAPFQIYRVNLPDPVAKGRTVTMAVSWRLSPQTFKTQWPYVGSQSLHLGLGSFWYPTMIGEDFFQARVSVTTPPSLVAITEGEPDTELTPLAQLQTVTWQIRVPVPLITLTLAPLVPVLKGSPLRIFAGPGVAGERVRKVADDFQAALDWYNRWLGSIDGPVPKIVEMDYGTAASSVGRSTWVFGGSLEQWGLSGPYAEAFMAAHEGAHQWIGNTVGLRLLGSGWLLEGLPEYLALLVVEHRFGSEARRAMMATRIQQTLETALAGEPGRPLNVIELFDSDAPLLYAKGALVLRHLHGLVGDEAFFAGVRRFVEENRFTHVDWRRFIAAMETVSHRRLDDFVQTWIQGSSGIDLGISLARQDGDRFQLLIEDRIDAIPVERVQVQIRTAGGPARKQWIRVGDRVFIDADGDVTEIIVDPDSWIPDVNRANNRWRPAD